MPNWCEGWVKFRGPKENLMKFIESEFDGAHPVFDERFDEIIPNILERYTFLNSLRRAYVSSDDLADSNGGICLGEEEFEYKSNGDEVLYNVHEVEDYTWECECPTLGG